MDQTGLLLLAVLLRIVSNPLGNVFQKRLTTAGHNPLLVNVLTYLLLAVVSLFWAINVPWLQLSGRFWLYSVLAGLAGALGNGLLVRALQTGDLSVLGPINAYKSVVGIAGGFLLLGEIPTGWGLLGIALIICGSYFVLDTTTDRFSWRLLAQPAIQFRLWAMVLTAIEAVLIKRVITTSSTTVAFLSWCWFGVLFAGLFWAVSTNDKQRQLSRITPADGLTYLWLIGSIGVMQFTTTYAFGHMPVGYALALFQLSTLVSVFFGHRFFNETGIRQKLLGSAIMLIGSVIISLL